MPLRGFYAIVDREALVEPLLAGGACAIQLRHKTLPSGELRALARALRARIADRAWFVVNDRADIAVLANADALHLGQDDLPLAAARRAAPAMRIGVSTHTLAQALAAERDGADYLGFGPIFATGSKQRPDAVVGLDALREVCGAVRIPVVAIGGVTLERAAEVAATGAAAAAVIAAVNDAADPEAAARTIARAWSGAAR